MRVLYLFLFVLYASQSVAQSNEPRYGNTIISVSPVQLTTYTPTGVGAQLEYFPGKNQKFSLYLPLAYSFGHPDPCFNGYTAKMFYAFPGIKYYPAGSAGP